MKRTPLFAAHQRLGGRLIEFGGWEMPVQYTGIVDEHLTVRKAAGLFDIAHMGEVAVRGAAAEDFLNRTLTNDVRKLAVGQGQYTLMCNPRGGVVDDLYVYRLRDREYLLIINASRIEADVAWLRQQAAAFGQERSSDLARAGAPALAGLNAGHTPARPGDAVAPKPAKAGAPVADSGCAPLELRNDSEEVGALALQGPRAVEFIGQCFPGVSSGGTAGVPVTELKKNQVGEFHFDGTKIWVSRTGYTGEDGFEIVAPAGLLEAIWDKLLALGRPHGLKPCGLGARDTLRTEVCYPLYGHELDEITTPIEAGVGFFVAMDKGEFVGRPVLAEQKASGVSRKLIAFKMTGPSAPPRPHYAIWNTGGEPARLGEVTSGTQSPSLGTGIGLGYVPPAFARRQSLIEIEIRGRRAAAVVGPKPIYRKAD